MSVATSMAAGGTALADAGSALAALGLLTATFAVAAVRSGSASLLIPSLPAHVPRSSATGFIDGLMVRTGRTSLAGRFRNRAGLRRRLSQAGDFTSVDAVLGVKLLLFFLTAALLIVGGILARSLIPALLMAVPIGFAASRVPDVALARRARRRQQRIGSRVPDLAELLVATTGAGLNPPLALRRSAEVLDAPLGEELRMAVRTLDLGTPWRAVLDELARRTGDPSIGRLVRAMERSQRLGTPLSSALHNVAEDLRTERQARAEELARRAPVKMLFPLVFLILPAFLLLTVGPVLLATLRSLR